MTTVILLWNHTTLFQLIRLSELFSCYANVRYHAVCWCLISL